MGRGEGSGQKDPTVLKVPQERETLPMTCWCMHLMSYTGEETLLTRPLCQVSIALLSVQASVVLVIF